MSVSDIQDPNDFLLAGGVPSAKFPTVGATVKGTIEHLEITQQRDFTTGEPKTYDDGNPAMQLVVTLTTAERDADISDDDGTRKLYVRGQMLAAVRSAVRASNSRLLVGGELVVKYVADKPSERRGMNPAKQYQAAYRPPAQDQGAVDDLIGATTTSQPSASDLL